MSQLLPKVIPICLFLWYRDQYQFIYKGSNLVPTQHWNNLLVLWIGYLYCLTWSSKWYSIGDTWHERFIVFEYAGWDQYCCFSSIHLLPKFNRELKVSRTNIPYFFVCVIQWACGVGCLASQFSFVTKKLLERWL